MGLRQRVERLEKRLQATTDGRCPACGRRRCIGWPDVVIAMWARRRGESPPPLCRCGPLALDPTLQAVLRVYQARHVRDAGSA